MEQSNKATGIVVGIIALLVVIGGIIWFTSNNNDETETVTEPATSQQDEAVAEPTQDIVGLASSSPDLSILVQAVQTANLVETLQSEGPFTVFAPTNAAFEALLGELGVSAEELLARDDLADILTYHVVSGEVLSSDLTDGQQVTTVQGGTLTVNINDGVVTLTDANGGTVQVATADVQASNGVVHIIDGVLLP